MSEFIQQSNRSVELPLGCKDLIDVQDIRDWKSVTRPDWLLLTKDRLAYMEGYLTRLLQQAGKSPLVLISRHQDGGSVLVVRDVDLVVPVVFVSWNGATQEHAVRAVFEQAGISPITEPVGRWKAKHSLKYPLATDHSIAAQFITGVFRMGYGLGDLASISMWYREKAG